MIILIISKYQYMNLFRYYQTAFQTAKTRD